MLGDLDLVNLTTEINYHSAHKLLWSFGVLFYGRASVSAGR